MYSGKPEHTTASKSMAARKSFLPSRYYMFEEFRLLAAQLRWLLFRVRAISSGELARRYWMVPLYALRDPSLKGFFSRATEELRASLRKTPTWADGHLMIASAEARLLEMAAGPEPRSLRAIEIEAEAFLTLLPPGLERREVGIAHTLRAWVKQVRGDLEGAIAGYEQVLMLSPKSAPALGERAAIIESAAWLAITLEDYPRARKLLLEIPEQFKTPEVVELLKRCSPT